MRSQFILSYMGLFPKKDWLILSMQTMHNQHFHFTLPCSLPLPRVVDSWCELSEQLFQAVLMPAMSISLVSIMALYWKGKKIRQQTSRMTSVAEHTTARERRALKTLLLLILTVVLMKVVGEPPPR